MLKNTNYKEGDQVSLGGLTTEFVIEDESGNAISNFYELEGKLPHNWKAETEKKHKFEFKNSFLVLPNETKFKINGVSFSYDIESKTRKSILEGEEIAKAIFKDIETGKIRFLNKNGKIKDVGKA